MGAIVQAMRLTLNCAAVGDGGGSGRRTRSGVEPDAVSGPADDTAAVLKKADVGGRDARGIGLNVTALVQGRAAGPQAAYADPV